MLSNKCFVCHGPDAKDEDLLRLDAFATATVDLGGYRAIDPAAPEKSRILVRIHSTDDPMPPADVKKQLSRKERDLISRWVREGGKYAQHWSFVPPRKPVPNSGPRANATACTARNPSINAPTSWTDANASDEAAISSAPAVRKSRRP